MMSSSTMKPSSTVDCFTVNSQKNILAFFGVFFLIFSSIFNMIEEVLFQLY